MRCKGTERDEMGWDGKERDGIESDVKGCDGMEWGGKR